VDCLYVQQSSSSPGIEDDGLNSHQHDHAREHTTRQSAGDTWPLSFCTFNKFNDVKLAALSRRLCDAMCVRRLIIYENISYDPPTALDKTTLWWLDDRVTEGFDLNAATW
jgi:hypothetical protein